MLSDNYLECLAACSELIEDAREVVQALHEKYRIAILTNGLQVVQRGRLARSVIRDQIFGDHHFGRDWFCQTCQGVLSISRWRGWAIRPYAKS